MEQSLKPGGYVVGETENIDCLSYRLFGPYWSLLHLPYHLLFFTPDTLRLSDLAALRADALKLIETVDFDG